MRSLPIVLVMTVGSAAPAFADDAWVKLGVGLAASSIEISCNVSTAISANSHRSPSASAKECDRDADCHPSYACVAERCYEGKRRDEAQAAPTQTVSAPAQTCTVQAECGDGLTCANGSCLTLPAMPVPSSSSLRRKGSELYLRERAVQLREELALGQGPVINGLAQVEGVPAKTLGRTMRQHRAELVALMGDGSSPEWATKFLTRVEELCGQS